MGGAPRKDIRDYVGIKTGTCSPIPRWFPLLPAKEEILECGKENVFDDANSKYPLLLFLGHKPALYPKSNYPWGRVKRQRTDLDDVTVLKGESIRAHTCTLRQTSQRNPVQSQPPTVLVLIEDSASPGFHSAVTNMESLWALLSANDLPVIPLPLYSSLWKKGAAYPSSLPQWQESTRNSGLLWGLVKVRLLCLHLFFIQALILSKSFHILKNVIRPNLWRIL